MQNILALVLPNHHHKKRPILLRNWSLFALVLLLCTSIFTSRFVVTSAPKVLGYAKNINISDLLSYTNKKRSEVNLASLKINKDLSDAAYNKALDMFEKDYWAHTAPDGSEPWDFIIASGYDQLHAGENLAVDFSDSDDVVEAWYDSPSHRDNLLSDKYTEIGFAVVNGELNGRETTLVVQMFGYPRVTQPLASSAATEGSSELVNVESEPVRAPEVVPNVVPSTVQVGAVLNASDVFSASKSIAIALGLFLTVLFAIDGFYVRLKDIPRISGHTFAHVLLLVIVIAGIWYTNIGLVL